MRKHLLKPAAAGLSLALLAACTSVVAPLLKPDVSTEITKVKAGDYELDPTHASVLFRINHLGFSTYVGRFETFDASLTGDAADPASSRVEAVIDMTSLDVANAPFATELMGPDWFDAEAFPQAVFRSTSVAMTGDTKAKVTGDLTLHGVTAPVTLDVTFNGAAYDRLRGADVAGFSAVTTIDRTVFGVSKFSGLVTDTVDIEIQAEFMKQ
ncbi:MAG: YceI family protein [Alphaproteobacteria bacterium]|nr:YceI family protein [Alphaproteobacteria bacterium]